MNTNTLNSKDAPFSTKGTSTATNSLIWMGAAISIAEIITGTYVAPLGLTKSLLAIFLGHLAGGTIMLLAGLIGAKERKTSMETCALAFGSKGAIIFAVLNVLQLIGWTSIMIFDGAMMASHIFPISQTYIAVLISALIVLWIWLGLHRIKWLSGVSAVALFILSLFLFYKLYNMPLALTPSTGEVTFGSAVELSAAMPLSWLPLISDYTKEAEKPVKATVASVVSYNLVSIFMYVIGMGLAFAHQGADIGLAMKVLGLGAGGIFIAVLSTVTTTFLDSYSAGVSSDFILGTNYVKRIATGVTGLGLVLALTLPLEDITPFLYLISSVFAPMVAVLIASYFTLGQKTTEAVNYVNVISWILGFALYRLTINYEVGLGVTINCIIATYIITLVANKCCQLVSHEKK